MKKLFICLYLSLSCSVGYSERFFVGYEESKLNSVLMQMTSQLNQNLPIMIDSETRLDSTFGFNKQIRYNYTLVNYTVEEIDVNEFNKVTKPLLINSVCTSKEMAIFMENGMPVTYAYNGKNGKQFITITVHPSECKSY